MASVRKIGLPAIVLALILPLKAEEGAVPGDLGPKLEHLAIVLEMVRACSHARPDLSAELSDARQAWMRRNPEINNALDVANKLAGTPEGDAILYLFHSLQTSLEDQADTLEATGNTQYLARCDGVIADLRSSRWNYPASQRKERSNRGEPR